MAFIISKIATKRAEKRICIIKDNILNHRQNLDDYQNQLEDLFEEIKNEIYIDILRGIFRLVLYVITILAFIITFIVVLSYPVLTVPNRLFPIIFFAYLFVSFMRSIRKMIGKKDYDLDGYHTWEITKEETVIVDWWSPKIPIYGKLEFSICSICGVEKIEFVDDNKQREKITRADIARVEFFSP